jgi:hypothetical protein
MILISPTSTITSITVECMAVAKDWNEFSNMLKSGKFQISYKGKPTIYDLTYFGNQSQDANFIAKGKTEFSLKAAQNIKIGKGLTAASYGLSALSFIMVPIQWHLDPTYGDGFGGKKNEAAADLIMATIALQFPYGTAAEYVYNYRIKPVMKAKTPHEKEAAASSVRPILHGPYMKCPQCGKGGNGLRSDSTLKCNVSLVGSTLDNLMKLGVYTYGWKDSSYSNFGLKEYGFMAQEVDQLFPEIVKLDSTGHLNVAYYQMIPLLLKGIKEQQEQIKEQKEKIADLILIIDKLNRNLGEGN